MALQNSLIDVSRSVLVVDDDPMIHGRLEALLQPAGYSVTCVASVQQARDAMTAVFYPIVILDRMLTDGDGISLCSELRTNLQPNRVFVLVLSARDSSLDAACGLRAGADVYLSKRTSNAELLAYLEAAIAVAHFSAK